MRSRCIVNQRSMRATDLGLCLGVIVNENLFES